jgi:hypothetical protein
MKTAPPLRSCHNNDNRHDSYTHVQIRNFDPSPRIGTSIPLLRISWSVSGFEDVSLKGTFARSNALHCSPPSASPLATYHVLRGNAHCRFVRLRSRPGEADEDVLKRRIPDAPVQNRHARLPRRGQAIEDIGQQDVLTRYIILASAAQRVRPLRARTHAPHEFVHGRFFPRLHCNGENLQSPRRSREEQFQSALAAHVYSDQSHNERLRQNHGRTKHWTKRYCLILLTRYERRA